jgi:hypothetical protein
VDLDIRGEMEAAAAELGIEDGDLGQDASPASEPETTETPTADTTEPTADPAIEGAQDAKPEGESKPDATPEEDDFELPLGGSIPVPRVRKIIENTRRKTEALLRSQQPAETDEQKAQREAAVEFYRFAEQNPVEFYRRVTSRLQSDPVYAREVKAILGPHAPSADGAPPQPRDEDPEPVPDVILTDGRLVFSDARMKDLLAWQERKFDRKVNERFKPMEQTFEQRRAAVEIDRQAGEILADARTWPGMDSEENCKAVAQTMIEKGVDINKAYRLAVVPKLKTDEAAIEKRVRAAVLGELKRKANATTSSVAAIPADPKTFAGLSIREMVERTAEEMGIE